MASKRKPPGPRKLKLAPTAAVRRTRAIDLLADGWLVQEVAEELGVTRGAIWAMRDDAFDEEVMTKAEKRTGSAERARLGVAALEVLATLMRNAKVPAAVRRQAASDLADRAGLASAVKVDAKVSRGLAGLNDGDLETEILRLSDELREKRGAKT